MKVIPGSCSRYWESEFVLEVPIDMVAEGGGGLDYLYGKGLVDVETIAREERKKKDGRKEGRRRNEE